jgi:hypothetical protein
MQNYRLFCLRHWTLHGICFFAAALIWGPLFASAQTAGTNAEIQPPTGPLIVPAPAFSRWTATYTYPQEQGVRVKDPTRPLDPTLVRKIVVTKTRDIIHEETFRVSGDSFEKWQVGRAFYIKPSGQKYWGAYDENYIKNNSTPDTKYKFIPASGFRDLGWVGVETFVGELRQGNADYLIFVPTGAGKVDLSNPAKLQEQPNIAYVDASTRLPTLVKKDGVTCTYLFFTPLTKIQQLPDDLSHQIKEVSEKQAKLLGVPNREY